MEKQTNIGIMIKKLRMEKGLTQKKVSELTGLSLPAIIAYEQNKREPNSKAMAKLEQIFDVSGAYLRGETDQKEHIGVIVEDPVGIVGDRLLNTVRKGNRKTNKMMFDILVELTHTTELQLKDDISYYMDLLQNVLFETTCFIDIVNISNIHSEPERCQKAKQLALQRLNDYFDIYEKQIRNGKKQK